MENFNFCAVIKGFLNTKIFKKQKMHVWKDMELKE